MVQLFFRGHFKRVDLATLGIDPGHNVLDGAIFAGRVHRLKDKQQRPFILGVKQSLQFAQASGAFFEPLLRVVLGFDLPGISRIDIRQAKFLAVVNSILFGQRFSFHASPRLVRESPTVVSGAELPRTYWQRPARCSGDTLTSNGRYSLSGGGINAAVLAPRVSWSFSGMTLILPLRSKIAFSTCSIFPRLPFR